MGGGNIECKVVNPTPPFTPGLSHPFLGMGPGPIELGKFAAF